VTVAGEKEDRIRLSLSIDKNNPAYELLVKISGLSERRQLGMSFLTQGAAAFKLGFGRAGTNASNESSSTVDAEPESERATPRATKPDAQQKAGTWRKRSAVPQAILNL
jgi:hypothetical protein